MKRMLWKAALVLACSAGLAGCVRDLNELTSKNPPAAALTPPNDPPPQQAQPQPQPQPQMQMQGQPTTYRELPPLGSNPGAAPAAPNPGVWR